MMTACKSAYETTQRGLRSDRKRFRELFVFVTVVVFGVACLGPVSVTLAAQRSTRTKRDANTAAQATTQPPTLPTALSSASRRLAFRPCGSGISCAVLAVPRDHDDPTGEKIVLTIVLREATEPLRRQGVIVLNPGGPGGSTMDLVRSASQVFGVDVAAVYDVVGVEPRGVSLEVADTFRCWSPVVSRAMSRNELTRLANAECGMVDGKNLLYFDVESSARDIDAVRQALGEEQIVFVGVSYGAYLAAVYRTLFPDRVSRVVLDSAVDPYRFGDAMLIDPLAAQQRSLLAFFNACSSGRLQPCDFADGTDLPSKFRRVRARFLTMGTEPDRSSLFDNIVSTQAADPRSGWPILGRALQEISASGTVNFAHTKNDAGNPPPRTSLHWGTQSVFRAMVCRDGVYAGASSASILRRKAEAAAPLFPTFGDRAVHRATMCDGWAAPALPPFPVARSSSPVLGVANTLDVVTPFEWTESLVGQTGGRVLARSGGGHGALSASPCMRAHVERFLLEGKVPSSLLVCD